MKILFVCTGNTCRSPMAEAIATDKLLKMQVRKVKVSSCGLFADPKTRIEPNAVCALSQMGIEVKNRKAKPFDPKSARKVDYIITMTKNHKKALDGFDNVYSIDEFCNFEIPDPFKQPLDVYERTAKMIEHAVDIILDKIINIG